MNTEYRFVQAVDTLSFRGNKLFGDSGTHGESSFPPNPSVLSGAFRSLIFVQNNDDLEAIPEDFSITEIYPAQENTQGEVEALLPIPADIWVTNKGAQILRLQPQEVDPHIQHSQHQNLPMMPILRQSKQTKPENGWLLNQQGISAYLQGEELTRMHLTHQNELWSTEPRIGIGLNNTSRTADDGKLFTVEHAVPRQTEHNNTVGLIVGISGSNTTLPHDGFIRLGGDGRAASFIKTSAPTVPRIPQGSSFKIVLLTPGLFEKGWLPTGVTEKDREFWLNLQGIKARLVCASVSRAEIISGWDMEKWQPKMAEQGAPAGCVYWFDQFEGDSSLLENLANTGLWPENLDISTKTRKTEGYNRLLISAW